LASIGQPHLMIFHENFSDLGLLLHSVYCPILILRKSNQKSILNTINVLVENNYIPIIENDTVATDEKFIWWQR
jgi:glutamate 5-kinase